MCTAIVRRFFTVVVFFLSSVAIYSQEQPPEKPDASKPIKLSANPTRAAITKAIQLIEKSSGEYLKHRDCFSCHHQAHAILAIDAVRDKGFVIDEENYSAQTKRIVDHLKKGHKNYLAGKGQGGQVDTAGAMLWGLLSARIKPDKQTDAVVHYLKVRNRDKDYWRRSGNRPPTEASNFSTTCLAVTALKNFNRETDDQVVSDRLLKARKWLENTKTVDTEDRVFQIRGLAQFEDTTSTIETLAEKLLHQQHDDGGWSQTAKLKSDAYATGTVLSTLIEVGKLKADDPAAQAGFSFLLSSQKADGSWFVKSRSDPFQEYFETGFPHGTDQFISMSASCWAVICLAKNLPVKNKIIKDSDN